MQTTNDNIPTIDQSGVPIFNPLDPSLGLGSTTGAFTSLPKMDVLTSARNYEGEALNYSLQSVIQKSRMQSDRLVKSLGAPQGQDSSWGVTFDMTPDPFTRYEIKQDDIYKKLNSGELVPLYENYIHGTNNEQRLALAQTGWEKWKVGLTKFVGKTSLNILDGTVGTLNGLVEGMSEGSLNSVYNNDFGKYVDDLNTKLDYKLPNYATEEERNMGFLKSMGTANFWANDFLGGMSFTLGVLGSEAIWASVTGGASLAASLPKLALKHGFKETVGISGKVIAKNTAEEVGKTILSSPKKAMKSYLRTIPASNTGKALNNTRFLYTSAGFEAGIESRSSLNESLESFITSYKDTYGRVPDNNEYIDFMSQAVNNSNNIFAANVALVGSSNILQFGSYFGVGTGVNKKITDIIGKRFGVGISRVEGDKMIYKALKPNKYQKIAGNAVSILKIPVVEGFVEEGGQRIISETSKKWLASKYNPNAIHKNITLMNAAYQSFEETYTTSEGLKEVGLGMLIGLAGSAGSRGVRGGRTPFGVGGFGQQVEQNEMTAEALNEITPKLTTANQRLIDRLVTTNQFDTFIEKSNKSAEKGDFVTSSIEFEAAQFSKMWIENQAGMLDDSVKDFKKVLDNSSNDSITDYHNLAPEQITAYKDAILHVYQERVNTFKKALSIAESLQPDTSGIKGVDFREYTSELAFNIYQGESASQRGLDISESIEDLVGTTGIGSALRMYTNLNAKARRRAETIIKLEDEIDAITKEYETVRVKSIYTPNTQTRKDENVENVNKLSELQVREQKIVEKLTSKSRELEEVQRDLEGRFYKSKYNFAGQKGVYAEALSNEYIEDIQITGTLKELKKFDGYRKTLGKQNTEVSKQLELLLGEYTKNVNSFREFSIITERMADPRFMQYEYKGVASMFKNVGTKYNKETNTELDIAIETLVNSEDEGLTDAQKFTLQTLNRLSAGTMLGMSEESLLADMAGVEEVISDNAFDLFTADGTVTSEVESQIANRIGDGLALSPRQEHIYDKQKDNIDAIVKQNKLNKGDTIQDVLKETKKQEESKSNTTPVGKLRETINRIIKNKQYLRDFDFDNFSEEEIPTEKDFTNYRELLGKENKGTITPEQLVEKENLQEKINMWGRLEGTVVENDMVLTDLIEQVYALEDTSDIKSGTKFVTDIRDIVNSLSFKKGQRGGNYDNIQSYDKAFVRQNVDNTFSISNINVNGILDILENNLPIKVLRNNKVLDKKDKQWNINPKKGQKYVVRYPEGDSMETIMLTIGEGNNIVVSTQTRDKMNKDLPIKIIPTNDLPTNYQPLLKEVEIGLEKKLVPVNSNLTFDNGLQVDNDIIYTLKEAELLYLEVSTSDYWNKKLISEYLQDKNEITEEAIKNSMVIYLKTKENKLVGVVKAIGDTVVSTDDGFYNKVNSIRETAKNKLLKEYTMEGETIDLGMSIPVSQVYVGHPNFNIEENEGKYSIKNREFTQEMVDKVVDMGYILNGELYLHNKTKNFNAYPFLTSIMDSKDSKYKNNKVPIIVFEYGEKYYGYPISLKTTKENQTQLIDGILKSNLTTSQQIIAIDKLLKEKGFDLNLYGLTFENFNTENIERIKGLFSNLEGFPDISQWVTKEADIGTTLIGQGYINIDITDKPFHSPKIKTKIMGVNGLSTQHSTEMYTQGTLPTNIGQSVKKIQKEDC